jgi:hypothetical protein
MDNQFSASNLSVTNIAALSSVKEVVSVKKSKASALILIAMMIFAGLLVFLSVYQFNGVAKPLTTMHATSSYNKQVQQLAK